MKYSRIREVTPPTQAHPRDAGIDVFLPYITREYSRDILSMNEEACSYNGKDYPVTYDSEYEQNILSLYPNRTYKIPLGLKFDIPVGYALIAKDKSGIAFKTPLSVVGGVIDSGYQGEVILLLQNRSEVKEVNLTGGMKIAQLLLIPVATGSFPLKEVEISDLYNGRTTRGDGGFGSTGI